MRQISNWMWWAVGATAIGVFSMARKSVKPISSYSYGEADTNGISRDPNLLLPVFADKLETLFQRMRALGYDPYFYEGWRSPARAAKLAKKGTGITKSLHIYGAAADIISRKYKWSQPAFFKALGVEAKKLGLTWGGDFTDVDADHVQAVPADEKTQSALRASAEPNEFAKKYIG